MRPSLDGFSIPRNRTGSIRIIALGFLAVIFVGAILLSLPISSAEHIWTPFLNSLFTATSATCITGFVVYDTYTHWSLLGQLLILIMIQIGGIGFMSIITLISTFTGRRITLHERKLLMFESGNTRLSGMISLARYIIFGTIMFESIGAVILSTRFIPVFGFTRGLYYSVFHSVSAFCNAGFDLMGVIEPNSSLTYFRSDPVVNLTVCALVIIGGLGFMVWGNIIKEKFNFSHYSLHTKIVLSTTVILLVAGTILFFIFEKDSSFAGLPLGDRCLAAFFDSMTARSSGFSTTNVALLSESGTVLMIVLMMIGGSPGSTAGGLKTTTVAVVIMTALASARNDDCVTMFKKRFAENTLRRATTICLAYLSLTVISTMIICAIEPYPLKEVLFEVSSAIGTVGITMGLTPHMTPVSHLILIALMYAGRVGGMTLMLILIEKKPPAAIKRPMEEILIG